MMLGTCLFFSALVVSNNVWYRDLAEDAEDFPLCVYRAKRKLFNITENIYGMLHWGKNLVKRETLVSRPFGVGPGDLTVDVVFHAWWI